MGFPDAGPTRSSYPANVSPRCIPVLALVLGVAGCHRLQPPPASTTPGYEASGHFRSTAGTNHSRVKAEVRDAGTVPVEDGTLSYDEPVYADPSCPDSFVGSLLGSAIEAATGEPVCNDC